MECNGVQYSLGAFWWSNWQHNRRGISYIRTLSYVLQIRKICDIPSQPERIDCTLSLLCNETEEFKILEAIKLLMYDAAVKLYTRLNRGEDVPVFAMLLFARDSSESPRGLLTNHLNRTGDTGGLEQVSNQAQEKNNLKVHFCCSLKTFNFQECQKSKFKKIPKFHFVKY